MNGIVPALLAVLLAELGRPDLGLHAGSRLIAGVAATVAIVTVASIVGALAGRELTSWADALMIAVALVLAGVGQAQLAGPPRTGLAALVTFWSGGTPLLAFAFAARFGAVTTTIGIVIGLAAAAMLTFAETGDGVWPGRARLTGAIVLVTAGAVVAVGALRLV